MRVVAFTTKVLPSWNIYPLPGPVIWPERAASNVVCADNPLVAKSWEALDFAIEVSCFSSSVSFIRSSRTSNKSSSASANPDILQCNWMYQTRQEYRKAVYPVCTGESKSLYLMIVARNPALRDTISYTRPPIILIDSQDFTSFFRDPSRALWTCSLHVSQPVDSRPLW